MKNNKYKYNHKSYTYCSHCDCFANRDNYCMALSKQNKPFMCPFYKKKGTEDPITTNLVEKEFTFMIDSRKEKKNGNS